MKTNPSVAFTGAVSLFLLLFAVPASRAQVSGPIDVWPQNSSVEVGGTKQFGAYVPISPNTIIWLVNEVPGGNAELGTISAGGLYQAPLIAPANNLLIVKAQSVAYPATSKSTTLKVTRPYPWLWGVSPSSLQVGNYAVSLNGSNFAPDSQVQANGVDLPTTYVSKTKLTAIGFAAAPGTIKFAVRHPSPGPVTGNEVSATVNGAPVTVLISPKTVSVSLGGTQAFGATVTGSANTAVTWSVPGGSANGTVNSAGVYTAPATMPASPTITVRATSAAQAAAVSDALVTLTVPAPPVNYATLLTAARFLEQSSFGPTLATIAQVQQLGINGFLQQQFGLSPSAIPVPADNSAGALQQWVLHHYTVAPDQLRQRVVYALSQIVVVSVNKQTYADAMLPWMNILSQHAFGSYKDLLRDVTKSPSMGKFLDLANSVKPGVGTGANENYARELMQLFTIGLWQLNPDGTLATDGNGFAIPTYEQNDVAQLALALTGWTYATAPGATPNSQNNEYFGAPMETRPLNHATSAKTFLGCSIPAGQTVEQDLESVLNCLMTHPNTAPFLATRLIRSLVMSNPSPGYIQRVAQVFNNTAGNLQAVVTAVLTDTEARNDIPSPNSGRLKEPILHISSFLRALNGQFNSSQQLTYLYSHLAQSPLNPPSVFSWYSPLYRVPKSPLFGPEFQIYTPTEATLRGNLFHYLLSTVGSDFAIDLSPYQALGNDLPGLVELVNQRLLYGRMPAAMKQVLINAAMPGYDAKARIETVLYLTALSGQYAVQH